MTERANELSWRRLAPAIGAEIIGVDLARLSDRTFEQARALWYEHLVLLFRSQCLTEEEQWRFGTRFGPLAGTRFRNLEAGREGVVYVTNERKDGKPAGVLPDGEMQFHSDQCYRETPSQGSMLYAIEVPSEGGNTIFTNCYAAYEALSDGAKRRLEGLRALNVYDYNVSPTQRRDDLPVDAPAWSHPVVRTHPVTRRKALYVNRLMTVRIEGLAKPESEELLQTLFEHIERPQFSYEHVWRPGDALLWDNRCSQHARTWFDPRENRKLRRITLAGEPVLP